LTPDDVPLWDSLNHLKLITAVEQVYGIQFSMADVQSIDSIGKLQATIAAQG
jgi:acyl carrier protein